MAACRRHPGTPQGPHTVCPSCRELTVDISEAKNDVLERVLSDTLCSGVSVSSTTVGPDEAIELLGTHPEATYYKAPDALHIEVAGV